jgi:hypothetical protein
VSPDTDELSRTRRSGMARWFLNVVYELGTGRAVANARRERDETAEALVRIRALEARVLAMSRATRGVEAA